MERCEEKTETLKIPTPTLNHHLTQMYQIIFEKKAEKDFAALDRSIQKRITTAIDAKLMVNPDLFLIPLVGDLDGLYKFRVGDYRLLCKKNEEELIIIVVKLKHRREVYL